MGFLVLRIWSICGSVFWFSLLKSAVFRFWYLALFSGLPSFPNAFYGFPGFAGKVTPCSCAKTVIPRDHLQLEECITSPVSLAAVVWVVMAAKQPGGGKCSQFKSLW